MVTVDLMEPFVIVAEIIEYPGRLVGIPLGVELADTIEYAFDKARKRWPYHNLLASAWDNVNPQTRLAAIDADRQIY